MTTIVTRAGKGSALTWTEGDANITNLNNDKIENIVEDTTPQLGGNLDVQANSITTSVTNGDVTIEPNGNGSILLAHNDPNAGSAVVVGDGTNPGAIISSGATDMILGANGGATSINVAADGAILLSPDTGGSVDIETSLTRVGTGGAAATVTTNGAYNLTLSTNNGTVANVPTITLTSAGGIALQATAGSSVNVINSTFLHNMNTSVAGSQAFFNQAHATADANNFTLARARNTTVSPSAVQTGDELAEFYVAGHDGQTGVTGYEPAWGFNTTVTATPSSNVMPVRTDFLINTAANTLSTYHSIGTDLVFRVAELGTISGVTDLFVSAGTNGNIELSPDGTGSVLITSAVEVGGDIMAPTGSGLDLTLSGDGAGNVNLNSDTVRIGDNNTAATITTHGTGNLTLNTNAGTNSGSITINQGANGNITLTPNGTGSIVLDGLNWPQADGTNGQVLSTNGAGQTSWTTVSSGGLTDIVNDTTPQLGGNLDVQANSITTSVTNGSITLEPNGTGDVFLNADTVRVGDSAAAVTLTTNGAGTLTLNTNSGTNSGSIVINQGASTDIVLTPNGTGDIDLVADTVQIGDANAAATLTTNGTGNLTLNTNNGTNSGSIVINQGVNGNIVLTPNGTGDVNIDADTVRIGDSGGIATLLSNGGTLFLGTSGTQDIEIVSQGGVGSKITVAGANNGNITLEPNGSGDVYLTADTVRIGDANAQAALTTNGTGNLLLNTNNGTNSGYIQINQGANSGILIVPNGTGDVVLEADTIRLGDLDSQATVTTYGAGNLVLNTGNGAATGLIQITQGANANIEITPNGTGKINLDGQLWPNALGSAGQVLSTDASGVLSWTTPSGGSSSQSVAIATASNTLTVTTKRLNFNTENSDINGLITVGSDGTFTISNAGTYLIELMGNFSHGDANSWQLFNQTGNAILRTFTPGDISGTAIVGGFAHIHVITASNIYQWRNPNTSISTVVGTPILKVTKIA